MSDAGAQPPAVSQALLARVSAAVTHWDVALGQLIQLLEDLGEIAVEHDDHKVCRAIELLSDSGQQVMTMMREVKHLVRLCDPGRLTDDAGGGVN